MKASTTTRTTRVVRLSSALVKPSVMRFMPEFTTSHNRNGRMPLHALTEPSSSVPFASSAEHLSGLNPDSWRGFVALQQPNYPDQDQLKKYVDAIAAMPPLVFAGEARTLQDRLAAASRGDAFVVQGGDCAESF